MGLSDQLMSNCNLYYQKLVYRDKYKRNWYMPGAYRQTSYIFKFRELALLILEIVRYFSVRNQLEQHHGLGMNK